jgi:hypothetical protein
MGRESRFDRIEGDWYPTPESAASRLLPHLAPATTFIEPCAGDGRLVDWLQAAGHKCLSAFDINPRRPDIVQLNAMDWEGGLSLGTMIITNPPYARPVMHAMIDHFVQRSWCTWLLLEASWAHTKQAAPFLPHCAKIVSVGRMQIFDGTGTSGKKDFAWYQFVRRRSSAIQFYGWPL